MKVKDKRYSIQVNVVNDDDDVIDSFVAYYNPGDPTTVKHAESMQEIGGSGRLTSADIDQIIIALDGVLGEGSAEKIFKYDGPGYPLMNAIIEKVTEGIQDYTEKSEAADKEAKQKALIDSKKNAAPYIAPEA